MGEKKKKKGTIEPQEPVRVRFPRGKEIIGIVDKRLGGSRMKVRTVKGEELLARVPGRVKKYLWIREGDIVILDPWELDKEKADLIYKYKPNEVRVLKKKGMLGDFSTIEEF